MSLTPFIRHELEHQPGIAAAPENSCTRCSPPLGREPDPLLPGDPAAPAHRCRRRSKHRARPRTRTQTAPRRVCP